MRVVEEEDKRQRQAECRHSEEGVCTIHGIGAKKMFKPVRMTKTGPDGLPVRRMTRKTNYKCDGGMGGGRLRQTKLSFGGLLETRRGGRRDKQGSLGQSLTLDELCKNKKIFW